MATEVLPHWDVSNVFPGLESQEYAQAVDQLKAGLGDLDAYMEAHSIAGREPLLPGEPADQAAALAGYLERMNALLRLHGTLDSYVYAFFSTDSYNAVARRKTSELEALQVRLEQQEVLFRAWVGRVAQQPEPFAAALEQPGPVREHAFYLRETAERSRYLMGAAEETLAAELSLSGARAWEKLQAVVTTQVTVPFEREGRSEVLAMSTLQNLRTDPDGEVRRRAYEAELAAWQRVREPLAACMNGIKGAVNTLDLRRGRSDCLHRPLEQSRIDRETLEAMLGAVADSFPAFRRYFRHKAALLGQEEALPWWDLYAPVGTVHRRFGYAEAQDLLLERFGAFSPKLLSMARRAFAHNWIDAEPRAGKQAGAFCMGLPALEESRVLCNFDGSFEQVSTLAHELGHAYHNDCRAGKTALQRSTPMTLAETASILTETMVSEAALAQAAGEQKLPILESSLIKESQVCVDIYSRFLFEKEVFERRAQAELSADELCEMMLRAQRATYGDGLDPRYLHAYMWAWKPHYYDASRSFYNYPYTFGLLFGLGLYAIYRERGPAFVPEYEELLRSSGEDTAAGLAARFGIDIRQRGFWESSLKVIEERIEQYRLFGGARH